MRLEYWGIEITFEKLYAADFEYTGGNLMTSFLGLEVEQLDSGIYLHLDTYIQP